MQNNSVLTRHKGSNAIKLWYAAPANDYLEGLRIGMVWRAGKLVSATITGERTQSCTIIHAPAHGQIIDPNGEPVGIHHDGHRMTFNLISGRRYEMAVVAD